MSAKLCDDDASPLRALGKMRLPTKPTTPSSPATGLLGLLGRAGLVWLACAVLGCVYWLREDFGDVSLAQIMFHWRYLGGADTIDPSLVADFAVFCLAAPLAIALFATWFEHRVGNPLKGRFVGTPARRWTSAVSKWLPAVVVAGGLVTLASQTSAMQYLSPFGDSDYFADHYIRPSEVRIRGDKPKNLVLVYLESVEASYQSKEAFGRNLLASLSNLRPVSFDKYEQLPGTGFTIAAMVSTQCAIPLQLIGASDGNSQGEQAQDFLPGATCLGDILAARGYRNVFMGGASLSFSGKGKFLRGHHYQEAFGRDEWTKHGVSASNMSGWGLHDDDLFDRAKRKLRELHETGRPFNLTLLTVDTHAPKGYLSARCQQRGADELEGIIECTADQVADLVSYIRGMGYDEDTNVVVIGDHLSPPNEMGDKLSRVHNRSIYNAFFARTAPATNRPVIVHFDMLPTVLEFIGLSVEGGRLGLGYTAFGPPAAAFPVAQLRAELEQNVQAPSRAYRELWRPPVATAR